MMVEAKIKLATLHEAFDVDDVFSHQYYLRLPQIYKSIPTPTSSSADNASGSGNDATNTLLQLAGGGSIATPSRTNPSESTTTAGSGEENQNSNGSWDLDGALAHNHKMASLLKSHPSDTTNVLSYHSKLSMFDRGWEFVEVFLCPCEFYPISSCSVGSSQVFERDRDMVDFNEALERICLEVFFHEYKKQYRTIQNYGNNRNMREHNGGGSENSNQQVEIRNGKKYPRHPGPPHQDSDFEVEFSGCYHCGDKEHIYSQCPGRHDKGAKNHMLFNMHCHRPSTFHPNLDRGRFQISWNDSFRNFNTYSDNSGDGKRVMWDDDCGNRPSGQVLDNRLAWMSHNNHSHYGNGGNNQVNHQAQYRNNQETQGRYHGNQGNQGNQGNHGDQGN